MIGQGTAEPDASPAKSVESVTPTKKKAGHSHSAYTVLID